MLDFVVLTAFAYLIFRVVSKLFSNIESLFTPSPTVTASSPPSTKEEKAAKKVSQSPPKVTSISPSIKKEQPSCIPCRSSSQRPEKSQVNLLEEFAREEKVNRRSEQEASTLRRQLEEVRSENEQLRLQIEGHKKEKAGYVQRIEEIIQHVINSQAPPPEIPPEQQTDEEMKVLGELTREIDHAHQQELQKLNNREQELLQRLREDHEATKRDYEAQISQYSQQLEQQIEQLHAAKEREEALQQQLAFAQQEIQQISTKSIGKIQQSTPSPSKIRSPATPKDNQKQEKIQELESELVTLRKNLQLQGQECIELRNKQRKVEDRLAQSQKQAQELRGKLKLLRQESHIAENDKIEADIKLTAQVESLVQQKEDMQAQIALLNENLFREQQERNQIISQAKQQLTAQYETEIQNLTKNWEKAEQGRKDTERKFLELQSELQFVQSQLKATLESEKTLTSQLQALRSPKREKVTLSEVQGHTEYLRLKRKVEQLESEIKNSRLQQVESKESSADRKINYARTKGERPASPTFQYEAKEKTPPKVETSSSRSKDVVSTIFASEVEKTRSPNSQRYQTPLQKPVAQSSILEGGLLSEGFLGETNILNSEQREFLIGEIKAFKKIDVKRSRLLYRSLANNQLPLAEYTSNVPNVLVVVELINKKILAAFTQGAFNRQLANRPERKYSPATKAMIIDISLQHVIINTSSADTVRYDDHALIWGKNEFVVSSEEPQMLTCDLNCEDAVYPCNFKSQDMLGTNGNSCPISQFEVYRIFLG